MANPQAGPGRQLSRAQREKRAYRLIQVGSITGVATVVTAVLAIAGAITDRPAVVLAIATILVVVRFRSLTRRR